MFSKLLCIVNKSSYKKEQLKLHQGWGQVQYLYLVLIVLKYIFISILDVLEHGRPQEFFQGGGKPLGGGPQKICEGGPPYFFRQALKYAYQGGGCSFDARRVFF